jgi:peptidyl-prolyl cis-trans isomerase C
LISFLFSSGASSGKSCKARHILVKTEDQIKKVKERLEKGEEFGKLAKECSECPSGRSGGSLGSFSPGMMVPAFDRACFDPANKVGELIGLVQRHFGFHMLIVDERSGVDDGEAAKDK